MLPPHPHNLERRAGGLHNRKAKRALTRTKTRHPYMDTHRKIVLPKPPSKYANLRERRKLLDSLPEWRRPKDMRIRTT
ncbi:hypothetical protein V6N11_018614 [Hibiscus sabdariffa]|uniref:Uncharacterized protein n=1 Tax=Hibiscus sabdariffa TaxID=183260 RepID=A0ABR2N8E2_9ROSI